MKNSMKKTLTLMLLALAAGPACKKSTAKSETAEQKPVEKAPEKPIDLTDTVDVGAAITDPDDTGYKGLKAKAPAGSKTEAGLTGVLVRMGERQAFEISKAFEPGYVAKSKKEAQEDKLDKVVKFHVDSPDAILWETASELGGENNFHFAAEVKVGDVAYKCANSGYGNFTKSQAEALLKSCQSLTK